MKEDIYIIIYFTNFFSIILLIYNNNNIYTNYPIKFFFTNKS